jgi:hypothetical protein
MRRSRILHLIYINIGRKFKDLLKINIDSRFNIAKRKKRKIYITIYRIPTTDFEIENIEIYNGFDKKNDSSLIDIFSFHTFFAFSISFLRFSFSRPSILYSFIILSGIDIDSAIKIITVLIILIYFFVREKIEPASNIRRRSYVGNIFSVENR